MPKHILILGLLLITSCTITHRDNAIDKKEAEQIANKFYYYQELGRLSEIHDLIANEGKTEASLKEWDQLIIGAYHEYGVVRNFELDKWSTFVADGLITRGEYLLQYYVTRSPNKTFENLYLIRENDSIKIAGYEIKTDGY